MNGMLPSSLMPLAILAAAILAAMLSVAVRRDRRVVAGLAAGALAAALASLAWTPQSTGALLAVDRFALLFFGLILLAALAVSLLAYGYFAPPARRGEEFYVLLLLATVGAMTLAAAAHLASFFLGLEILSVALYGLIAYLHQRRKSLEAGFKYLVLAGASTAFMLFGMALLYLHVGRLDLAGVAAALGGDRLAAAPPLVWLGLAMFVVGLGFKLAIAPFHLWTPDVYEGAPAPATAFIATASKGAAAAFLLRFFHATGMSAGDPLWTAFAVMAAASMFVGNLMALRQDNVKRLLAYSSIAHLGYALVAFLAGGAAATQAVSFYLAAYFATTLTAFGVIAALSTPRREAETIDDFRSLLWRRPLLGALFVGALLSLAGIPLTAGFIGKFVVVAAGVQTAMWGLVFVLLVNSAIGLFYYLRLIVAMVRPLDAAEAPPAAPALSLTAGLALAALAVALVILGILPEPLLALVRAAGLDGQ